VAHIYKSLSDKGLVASINRGEVGILPTDTLYGVVCKAINEEAAKRLYELKDREKKPGTVVAADIDQLIELGFKARYLKAVEHYWPGPISVVIPTYELAYLHQGVGSVVVRISADTKLNALLNQTGPLLTSSANLPGKIPASTIQEAKEYFNDTIDFYVDGGDLSARQPSTIIRVVDDVVDVLREGSVKIDPETGKVLS
jgi:L-threonylcarbamoyladenylate synthase